MSTFTVDIRLKQKTLNFCCRVVLLDSYEILIDISSKSVKSKASVPLHCDNLQILDYIQAIKPILHIQSINQLINIRICHYQRKCLLKIFHKMPTNILFIGNNLIFHSLHKLYHIKLS